MCNGVVDTLKLWPVGCRLRGGSLCPLVESFEGVPSVLDGFPVWWGSLCPGDPQDGKWVVKLGVLLKVVEGHGVLVDVGEGVGG